jgi:hypothetical protein
MVDFYFTAYLTLLFAVIVPGVLLTLPPGGSKLVVALTHGLVFAIVFQVITFYLFDINSTSEGDEGFFVRPSRQAVRLRQASVSRAQRNRR